MQANNSDPRIYCQLQDLMALQPKAAALAALPKRAMKNILTGSHRSHLRGRGLNFEELRGYTVGDDIRTMDWKVTNRTRKPHVRVYTEERERNVLLLVDQRSHMFFGSQAYIKSVTAAEASTLALWHTLAQHDRIGALVFDDEHIQQIKPQRSRAASLQILQSIVAKNNALSAQPHKQKPEQLNHVLTEALRLCGHDYLVILVSDLNGMDTHTTQTLKRIKTHNDVIVTQVVDPMEQRLESLETQDHALVMGDGDLQINVNPKKAVWTKEYESTQIHAQSNLENALRLLRIPLLTVDTLSQPHGQLQTAITASAQQ